MRPPSDPDRRELLQSLEAREREIVRSTPRLRG